MAVIFEVSWIFKVQIYNSPMIKLPVKQIYFLNNIYEIWHTNKFLIFGGRKTSEYMNVLWCELREKYVNQEFIVTEAESRMLAARDEETVEVACWNMFKNHWDNNI